VEESKMSIFAMIWFGSVITILIGVITYTLSVNYSQEDFAIGLICMGVGLFVVTSVVTISTANSITHEDTTPQTITRTPDGFTIVTYQNIAITSDKSTTYLQPDSNILMRVSQDYNHWGWRLNPVKHEIILKNN
jgi:ABC-type uncharacterized transport system permease subunit